MTLLLSLETHPSHAVTDDHVRSFLMSEEDMVTFFQETRTVLKVDGGVKQHKCGVDLHLDGCHVSYKCSELPGTHGQN